MNIHERRLWLKQLIMELPALKVQRLEQKLQRIDASFHGGRWEIGFSSTLGVSSLDFRYFGSPVEFKDWKVSAWEVLGSTSALSNFLRDPAPLPWMSLHWDLTTDQPVSLVFYRGEKNKAFDARGFLCIDGHQEPEFISLSRGALSADILGPLAAEPMFVPSGLCPVDDMALEWGRDEAGSRILRSWSLRLRDGLPWPLFMTLEISRAFARNSSFYSLIMLDRKVRELMSRNQSLWAYVGR